ncbi:MAG: ATP-binding protein [Clostridium butyricum]|nr:ATP-binding protein [Clostridium butyricum]
MDIRKLNSILKREEGPKLDFKLRLELWNETGKKELAKDVCAIANSNGGRGHIIIGIEDKTKRIVGINDEDMFKEEQVQQIITSRCEPPIPIEVEFIEIEKKKVCVICIYDGEQKPYQVRENGAFYIRRGSTTDVMRKQELVAAFEENLSLTIETCPVMRSDESMLNMNLVTTYFEKKGIKINEENRKFLLLTTGILFEDKEKSKLRCTYGGLLVFSDKNSLCIPNNMIKIIDKLNNEYGEVYIVQGNLLSMIDKAEEIIEKLIPEGYSLLSIIEAVKNAVLYREYFDLNRIIEISITKTSVVVCSPGEFIDYNIKGQSTNYNRRNIWLYEKLITIDEKNRFLNNGRGFFRIKSGFRGKGKVKFINSRVEHSFKVILPGPYIINK